MAGSLVLMKPWLAALVCVLFLSGVGRSGASVVPHAGNYTGSSTGGHHVAFHVQGGSVLDFRFGHTKLAPSMVIHSNGVAFYRNTKIQVTCHWSSPAHVTGTVTALTSGQYYHWSAHL